MPGEIGTNPAWLARRRRRVLGPLLIGVTLLAVAGWASAAQTASRRRAVTTTAVIEEVHHGPFQETQTGERTFEVRGRVRYQVDGTDIRATVTLVRGCDASPVCLQRYQPGHQVAVAYDPDHPSDAALLVRSRRAFQRRRGLRPVARWRAVRPRPSRRLS